MRTCRAPKSQELTLHGHAGYVAKPRKAMWASAPLIKEAPIGDADVDKAGRKEA
jgi:hypothetical protein